MPLQNWANLENNWEYCKRPVELFDTLTLQKSWADDKQRKMFCGKIVQEDNLPCLSLYSFIF